LRSRHRRSGIGLGGVGRRLRVLDRFSRGTSAKQQARAKQRDQWGFHQNMSHSSFLPECDPKEMATAEVL
jgi:hypothetical protein